MTNDRAVQATGRDFICRREIRDICDIWISLLGSRYHQQKLMLLR